MTGQTSTTPASPKPLVTQAALEAFTQRLVERFAPEQVILFGSLARGEARWDSDADLLVVMLFEGRSLETVKAMRYCMASFRIPSCYLARPTLGTWPSPANLRFRTPRCVIRW